MAQQGSAPVALGLGGIAAVLLISGFQGKSVGDILKGNFGESPDPGGGGAGLETPAKGTTEVPSNIPAGLISPIPKSAKVSWGRSDQGIDGVISPGTPLRAMGTGRVEYAPADPSGFGSKYLILHIDGDGAFYYGHSVPAVPNGSRVQKGQVIATANTHGQGNATTPGSFEIGAWPPGTMSAGAKIRSWFLGLPRI